MMSLQNNWDTTSALKDQFLSFTTPVNPLKIWTLGFVLNSLYRSNRQYSLSDNRLYNRKVLQSLTSQLRLVIFTIFSCSPNVLHGFLRW